VPSWERSADEQGGDDEALGDDASPVSSVRLHMAIKLEHFFARAIPFNMPVHRR
jgi:hypothetical protein